MHHFLLPAYTHCLQKYFIIISPKIFWLFSPSWCRRCSGYSRGEECKFSLLLDVEESNVWGDGLVNILHKCVPHTNIHNNCDNHRNQVEVFFKIFVVKGLSYLSLNLFTQYLHFLLFRQNENQIDNLLAFRR